MAIIRSKREERFTVINNCVLERNKLSFGAMGMLCYLLSKPDNWSVSVAELIKTTEDTAKKSGRDAVYGLLDELISNGFIVRTKRSDGKMDYTVFDEPVTDNPYYGKDVLREIPITEKPDTANPTLIKTETTTSTKKELTSTNIAGTSEDVPPTEVIPCLPTPVVPTPSLPEKPKKQANPENISTWNAYKQAYFAKYGVEPLRNAKVNGQVASLVKSVGGDIAPVLAAYYVSHNNSWFTQKRHDFGVLLANYQQVYTDMMRNEQMTTQKARQQEKTQNMGQVANELIAQFEKEAAL